VTKPFENQTDSFAAKSPYIERFRIRDVTGINEKRYKEEIKEAQKDMDEDWIPQNQSPMVDRISGTMEELERTQNSEFIASDEVRECLKDSIDCYKICAESTLRCLTIGGKHAAIGNINLLMDCSKICSVNADFMLRNSTYYPQICGITADICDECADVCERFEDDFMKECANICRRCAESCREMAR
jgi:hypothetical protein